jgi:hypothetical protein
MRLMHGVPGALGGVLAALAPMQEPGLARDYRTEFTGRYCVECHGGSDPEADFNIESAPYDLTDGDSRDRWLQVVDYVEHGEMPPSDAPLHPQPAEIKRFLDAIAADMQAPTEVPRAVAAFRRMTRTEHLNTLTDLFEIRGLSLPERFPEEVSASQFDTRADGLYSSAAHLGAVLQTAAEVADRIVPVPPPKPMHVALTSADWGRGLVRKADPEAFYFPGINVSERTGGLSGKGFVAPVPGVYSVRMVGNAEGPSGFDGKPLTLGFYAIDRSGYLYPQRVERRKLVHLAELEVRNLQPEELVCEIELEQGESIQVFCENRIRVDYPADGTSIEDQIQHFNKLRASSAPTVRIETLEITGPVRPLPRQSRLLGGREPVAQEDYVRSVILPLAERAYRRPLTKTEQDELVEPVMQHMAESPAPSYGIHYAIRRILTAPQFLFLNGESDPRDPYGLASRLSYFLWSSLPDAELLELAKEGRLTDPEVLRAQVLRMLDDPRSMRFIESLAGQWLGNREADTVMVCDARYEWSELVRYGYLRSTEMFLEEILRENLSIRTFIDSDFTYANEPMRIVWGFPGEHPSWAELEERRVQGAIYPEPERLDLTALEPDVPDHVATRGGVLGLSSVLLATGDGINSSPILRGVWVLENLFGTPTPPPPDNVPALVPDLTKARTVPEILDMHKASESCTHCHARIDPLGLALEHYDAIGNWRTEYSVMTVAPDGTESFTALPLETSAVLPDGTPIEGPGDIKAFLMRNPSMFTRCLTTKLIEYASGRELSAGEARVVEEIVAAEPADGYGFQDLIQAVIESAVFLGE